MKNSALCATQAMLASGLLAVTLMLSSTPIGAFMPKLGTSSLDDLVFSKHELWITAKVTDLSSLGAQVPLALSTEWTRFLQEQDKKMTLTLDRITGKPAVIQGEGIPWIPGTANTLTSANLGLAPGLAGKDIPLNVVATKALAMLQQYPALFEIDTDSLVLNENGSGPVLDYLYNVNFSWSYYGISVERAHLGFHLSHGNLAQVGQEFICDSISSVDPSPYISLDIAWLIVWQYVGGPIPGDAIVEPGHLTIIPVSTSPVLSGQTVTPGAGLAYRLVYTLSFHRAGIMGTWEARIDAHTGEILSFIDANYYGHIQGGVYRTDAPLSEVTMPFPYADYNTGKFADGLGNFTGTTGSCDLYGKYVAVWSGDNDKPWEGCDPDSSDEISLSTTDGLIDFGSSSGTDCVTPGVGGVGNTHAARTTYWNLTQMKLKAKQYMSSNIWINRSLSNFVNRNPGCIAGWQKAIMDSNDNISYTKSDTSGCPDNYYHCCANAGEFPGMSIHEWGHGMDAYDGSYSDSDTPNPAPDNFPVEARADWTAILQTHDSCVGRGFLLSNAFHGYGNPCTSCTGARDADYELHQTPFAWKPQNYKTFWGQWNPTEADDLGNCDSGDYLGPCGWEDHCESGIATQALWDLVNRDLTGPLSNMDLPTAWQLAERMLYAEMANSHSMYSCDTTVTPVDSNGCSVEASLYGRLRHADDCDGDRSNGTPHAAAIFAALNRHGIACGNASDATNQNQDPATCPDPNCLTLGKVALRGTSHSCWNYLTWNSIPNATKYNVYRNETMCGMGFIKIASVASPDFTDISVYEGVTYNYRVQAVGSSDACVGPVSDCVTLIASCAPPCTAPGAPALNDPTDGCTGIALSWTPGSGTTLAYNIYRKAAPCGGSYSKIAGGITATAYTDIMAVPGTQYAYIVEGACDAQGTVLSPASNCKTTHHAGSGISGKVTNTTYSGNTSHTDPVVSVTIHISGLNAPFDIYTNNNGDYSFQNLQGGNYHIKAFEPRQDYQGDDYDFYYNPIVGRSVQTCHSSHANQNFWMKTYLVKGAMGPVQQAPGVIQGWTVTAISANYSATTTTDELGEYSLLLPEGSYQLSMSKSCHIAYPAYLSVNLSGSQAPGDQNFPWGGWESCGECYPTLFKELGSCGGLTIGQEECIGMATRKFQGCALAKTLDAASRLYNSTLLSVQVQRSTAKPEEQAFPITVEEEGDYWVSVTNGDAYDPKTAIASADISLAPYGPLFAPSDFNKNVFLLKKQIHLPPGDYVLQSTLRSQPDSYLTIVVSSVDIASFPDLP